MTKLRVIDLFSGIGGFSLGLERATNKGQINGFETVAFCEIEAYPRKVLAKHWPNVPCYDDVRTLTAERLAADGFAVDVICGGFPCQDISTAGKGAGLAGERSGLWSEIARLVGELSPRFVIVENVAALLSRGLGDVLGDLAALGYDAEWHCIPASYVGAHHRRDRIWIVAYPSLLQRNGGKFYGKHCECEVSQLRTGSGAVNMADATGQRLQGPWEPIIGRSQTTQRKGKAVGFVASGVRNFWSVEPDVGGKLDGFSVWLDGLDLTEPHKLVMANANATNTRPEEMLRTLRSGVFPQNDEWQAGRSFSISSQAVLFAFLCQLEKRTVDEAWLQLESAQTPCEELRGLRARQEPPCASHRSGASEQHSEEHSNALQALSRLLAYHAEKAWLAYRRSDAAIALGWESGIARVAHGIPDRAHRLKGLGNAVVPQIPELIGNAILEAINA